MFISAQLSLYPLRQNHLSPAIDNALRIFKERGLETIPGQMSTTVAGDDKLVFESLREAFLNNAEQGDIVMVVSFSNACPIDRNK